MPRHRSRLTHLLVTLLLVALFLVAGATVSADDPGLFERTLTRDVETSARQELLDWADSIGVSTQGSRRQVENRILQYYNVPRESAAAESPDREGTVMRIARARGSRFFDIEQVDERNLRLVGGVLLTVEEDGAVHTIEAEEIRINLERSTLSARGNVFYTVERPDGQEQFRGESVVFQIESWEGVFFRGVTETREQIDAEEIDFFVEGERISRSGEEIVVVEGGRITSSKADPPNWRIEASRIWILAPGEWGLRHAVLHVGRVPMFYLPFFFLPGDRLFFHPVAGSRSREGAFIQTTTYFFGQRDDTDPPISIMRLAEAPEESDRVIQGLFLRIPEEPREQTRPNWSLKLMADTYTTLGAYTGIAASMPELGPFNRLDWRLGLGVSRNIYFRDGLYSSYYSEDGEAREHWNSGFFLGTAVPFRYEMELTANARLGPLTATIDTPLVSDPAFRRDFHDRSERMDWGFFLSPSDEDADSAPAPINSLNWEAGVTWNPNVRQFNPWVTSFSLSPARTQLAWRSRIDTERPAAVQRPGSDNSPEERFLFPQSAVIPDMGLRIRGTLFQYPLRDRPPSAPQDAGADGAAEEETTVGDRGPLRPPWEQEPPDTPVHDEDRYRLPARIGNVSGLQDPATGRLTVTYNLQPTLRYERVTDNDDWTTGSDVGLTWRYSRFQHRNRGQLTTSAHSRDQLATLSNTLSFDHRYQSLDVTADVGETEKARLELDTFRYRGFTVNQSSQLNLFPLRALDDWQNSSLRYTLASVVFQNRFLELTDSGNPRYDNRWGEWEKEDVTTHQTRAQLQWKLWSATQTLTATSDLPPRDRTYLGELQMVTGPVTTTLSGGYRERDDEWSPDNFVQRHQLSLFSGGLRLEQRFEYDMEENHLQQTRTTANVWPLRVQLTGQRTEGYEFDPTAGWVRDERERFHWTRATLSLGGEQHLRRWNRRIDATLQGELALDVDVQRYSASSLILDYGVKFNIHRFLDLQFTARSRNDFVYQYFPSLAEEIGRQPRNLLEDFGNSINMFDRTSREDSLFKIDAFKLTAIHDLQDWELQVGYTGRPELETNGSLSVYRWRSIVTVLLQWKPISEFRRNIQVEDGKIDFID